MFVAYTDYRTNGDTFVVEYAVSRDNPNVADPKSGRLLLAVDQPFVEHNGGTLRFGPDGFLYIGMGDGGHNGDPYDHAQDRTSLLGKLLRIDVDAEGSTPYAIPHGQPVRQSAARRQPLRPGRHARPIQTHERRQGNRSGPRIRRRSSPRPALSSGPGPRSGRSACAIRGNSPSIRKQENSTSRMSVTAPGRRSTSSRTAAGAASTTAGTGRKDPTATRMTYPPARASSLARCRSPSTRMDEDHCAIVGIGVYRGSHLPVAGRHLLPRRSLFRYDLGTRAVREDAWDYEPLLETHSASNGGGQDAAGELYVAASWRARLALTSIPTSTRPGRSGGSLRPTMCQRGNGRSTRRSAARATLRRDEGTATPNCASRERTRRTSPMR